MPLPSNSKNTDSSDVQRASGRRRSSSVKGMFTSFFGLQHESGVVKNKIKEGNIPARRASTPGSIYQLPFDAPSLGPPQLLMNYVPEYSESFREEDDCQIDNSGISIESTTDTRCDAPLQSELESFLESIGDVENDPNVGSLNSRRFLSYYLSERGFILPKFLMSSDDLKMFSVTCGKMVFLPTVSTTDEEYLNNLDRSANNSGFRDAELNGQEVQNDVEDVPETLQSESSVESLDTDFSSTVEPARALTAGVDDENNASYNIAVVILVNKPVQLSPISTLLCSHVSIHWCNGLPGDRSKYEEHYTNGELKWTLSKDDYNLYVPRNIGPTEQAIQRDNVSIPPKVFRAKSSQQTEYEKSKKQRKQKFLNKISNKKYNFEPGYYVFILPIRFSHLAPETIYVPSGRLSYSFYCGLRCMQLPEKALHPTSDTNNENKASGETAHSPKLAGKLLKAVKAHLHIASPLESVPSSIRKDIVFGSTCLTVVRTPPQRSISTADKPIYINRIWADSLSYEISLAQKYAPLGATIPLKIKLVPLVKNISVKRLRINIIEKIKFKSRDLKYDFDQVDVITEGAYSPFFPDFQPKRRPTRSLPLLEVRARKKGIRAVKEVIIENSPSENILCYSLLHDHVNGKPSELLDALTIETHLTFPKYPILTRQSSKWIPPYGIDEFVSAPESQHRFVAPNVMGLIYGKRPSSSSGSASAQMGSCTSSSSPKASKSHDTNFVSNSNVPVLYHCKRNRAKRGLYMDSSSLSNINVKHKLEIMLRISKKDAKDANKTKHYEVLIDTPIIIVSEHCNYQNLELPTYDMATKERSSIRPTLPTFDEVTSVPTSPQTSPRTSPLTSPIGSPNVQASYDPDDLSIQQLSLSRATTHTQNADSPNLPEFRVIRRYSNIDEIFRPESSSWLQVGSSLDQPSESRSSQHSSRPSGGSPVRNKDGPPNYNTICL